MNTGLRYPARRYVYYLLSRRTYSLEEIVDHLRGLSLPIPEDQTEARALVTRLVHIQKQMRFPAEFNPLAPGGMSPSTRNFLDQWEITDFWLHTPAVRAAFDILFDPQLRRTLEGLLLGPLRTADIARRLAGRHGLSDQQMNTRVVRMYSHYFWDYASMNIAEWKHLLRRWLPQDDGADLIASLVSPRNPAGAAMSLAVMDRGLDSLAPEEIYSTFRDLGFRIFLESALLQGPGLSRAQSAFLCFQMVKGAEEELMKHRGGSAELLEELRRIDVVYDKRHVIDVASIPTLRSPNTVSLPTIIEADDEEQ